MAECKPDIVSKLKDIVTCAVCYKLLEKPNTFTCLHTFCQPCLENMERRSLGEDTGHICPMCRKFCKIQDIRLDTFLLKNMLEVYNIAIGEEGKRMCTKCKVEVPTHRCLNCKDDMCLSCKAFHDQFALMKVHKSIEIGDTKDDIKVDRLLFCTEHPDKQIELYCTKCKVCICVICKVINHDGHPSDTPENALSKVLPSIQIKQNEIEAHMKDKSKRLEETTAHGVFIQDEIEAIRKEVIAVFEAKERKLNNEKQILLDKLDKLKNEKELECLDVCQNLENVIKEQKQVLMWVDGTLMTTSGVCLLSQLHGDLGRRVEILAEDSCAVSCKAQLSSLGVKFKPVKEDDMPVLGKIEKIFTGIKTKKNISIQPESHLFEMELHYLHTKYPTRDTKATVTIPTSEAPAGFHHVCVREGKLWLVHGFSKDIRIYNSSGVLEEKKRLNGIFSPRALVPLSTSYIAIASQSGLAVVDTSNMETTKLTNWLCNSICVSRSVLYALDFDNRDVFSFGLDKEEKTWDLMNEVHLSEVSHNGPGDKILVDDGFIYLSVEKGNQIVQYSLDGKLITRCENFCGTFINGPRLCGKDKLGHLLICNTGDRTMYFLNTRRNKMSKINISLEDEDGPLRYAASESETSLWIQIGVRTFQRYTLQE